MSTKDTSGGVAGDQDIKGDDSREDVATETRPDQDTTNYGSISSFPSPTAQFGQATTDRSSQRPQVRTPGSPTPRSEFPSSPLPSSQSPQVASKAQKPPALRRGSTKKPSIPQRGQEFSVDDDPAELEADLQAEQSSLNPQMLSSVQSPRKQETMTRRRTAAQATSLPRVDSGEVVPGLATRPSQSRDRLPSDHAVEEPRPDYQDGEGIQAVEPDDELVDDDETEQEIVEADDDDGSVSDAESFTLKDRQSAINQTHPFGIRIWKPALYKKNRSVEKTAEEDIHSVPSASVSNWLWFFNALWTLLFGWWLALACLFSALVCLIFVAIDSSARDYSRVFRNLSRYLFYPFGQFVKLESDENYAEEDEGEGRSISEYQRWQIGDLEHGRLFFGPEATSSIVGRRRSSVESASEQDSLLGRTHRQETTSPKTSRNKRRMFGRGQWTVGRVVFYALFYALVAPLMFLAGAVCWMMVFWIPMARVSHLLFQHLRKHPLALSFHPDATYSRSSTAPSSILLCTYRAAGTKYWKYTVEGTNVFLINLLSLVVFVIVDYFVFAEKLQVKTWLTGPALLFSLSLLSVVPLAYFIGQAVASISAQSSMGMGAAVNAFFSTIVEVYLYCVALNDGKSQLVEGSIIGSVFAGILFLPGLSMCFGAIKRKTQRFNVKSAGATSTMLLFAVIAAFGPTLFYKIYGSHELICYSCSPIDGSGDEPNRDCRRCFFRQTPAYNDEFFVQAVRPYCWFAAVMLFFSYVIGLFFTLRTHAAVIWTTEIDEKKVAPMPSLPPGPVSHETRQHSAMNGPSSLPTAPSPMIPSAPVQDSALYKSILGHSLKHAGIKTSDDIRSGGQTAGKKTSSSLSQSQELDPSQADQSSTPHLAPTKSRDGEVIGSGTFSGVSTMSEAEHRRLTTYVAEIAATAATVAARDATKPLRRTSTLTHTTHLGDKTSRPQPIPPGHGGASAAAPPPPPPLPSADPHRPHVESEAPAGHGSGAESGGHDAPNWSRTKSSIILCAATVAYALVAEVLVGTVDVVLESADVDQKFLGITLFALVPNTTEFLNAISFAMNGNIALSMEIGSAYALQVCLLQVPALVLFSAVQAAWSPGTDMVNQTFSLIFPQFDMVTVILCVFLLSYIYSEGKSNYFKGGILILTYLVVILGFFLSGLTHVDDPHALGMEVVDYRDTLALGGSPVVRTSSSSSSSSLSLLSSGQHHRKEL